MMDDDEVIAQSTAEYFNLFDVKTAYVTSFEEAVTFLSRHEVSLRDEEASVIEDIVRRYDDRGLVNAGEIPKTLINVDTRRLGQVMGNIISNS